MKCLSQAHSKGKTACENEERVLSRARGNEVSKLIGRRRRTGRKGGCRREVARFRDEEGVAVHEGLGGMTTGLRVALGGEIRALDRELTGNCSQLMRRETAMRA